MRFDAGKLISEKACIVQCAQKQTLLRLPVGCRQARTLSILADATSEQLKNAWPYPFRYSRKRSIHGDRAARLATSVAVSSTIKCMAAAMSRKHASRSESEMTTGKEHDAHPKHEPQCALTVLYGT
jgi:hypothetical protein